MLDMKFEILLLSFRLRSSIVLLQFPLDTLPVRGLLTLLLLLILQVTVVSLGLVSVVVSLIVFIKFGCVVIECREARTILALLLTILFPASPFPCNKISLY